MGWEHRPSSEIQMGNGTLLATFDAWGDIEQLFAPNIDALQSRVGAFHTSVVIPAAAGTHGHPEIIPIRSECFNVRVQMGLGSQILELEYYHKYRPLKLSRRIAIHPSISVPLIPHHSSGRVVPKTTSNCLDDPLGSGMFSMEDSKRIN